MDGYLESFIYLLITIVILVLSMRKKKPVQPPVSDESTESGDPFTELFKDYDEEDEYDEEPRPVTGPESFQAEENESTPWMTESEARDMVMDADAVLKEASDNNPIADYEGEVKDAYEADTDLDKGIPFDLKKAVIYSEILEKRSF